MLNFGPPWHEVGLAKMVRDHPILFVLILVAGGVGVILSVLYLLSQWLFE